MNLKSKGETSYKETSFGIISRSELIPLEIEGIKRTWDFILEQHFKGHIPITIAFLQKVHDIGFGWIIPEIGGKFRTVEVSVSKHKPPLFYQVPQLMNDFIEDFKVRLKHLPDLEKTKTLDEHIDLLTWAHHRFLWIHPFVDYNGRLGRLLINMILLNLNLPPVELKVETRSGREKYIEALSKADVGDPTALKRILYSALEESAKDLSS